MSSRRSSGVSFTAIAGVVVTRVGTLSSAGPDAVTFLANPLYRAQLARTRAAAVIVAPRDRARLSRREPRASGALSHLRAHRRFAASAARPSLPGVHASAVVAASARVAAGAQIDAHAVDRQRLHDRRRRGRRRRAPSSARTSTVGKGTRLGPRVTVLDGVRIGARCIVHPGAVIGADGFGFAPDRGTWQKIPQVGSVVIGDDVEIGANTTIDRGTIEDTVIEDGVKLDNLVQIAHNVRIGAHTIMAAMSGVAGSTKVGKRCMIGGGVVMINR